MLTGNNISSHPHDNIAGNLNSSLNWKIGGSSGMAPSAESRPQYQDSSDYIQNSANPGARQQKVVQGLNNIKNQYELED